MSRITHRMNAVKLGIISLTEIRMRPNTAVIITTACMSMDAPFIITSPATITRVPIGKLETTGDPILGTSGAIPTDTDGDTIGTTPGTATVGGGMNRRVLGDV